MADANKSYLDQVVDFVASFSPSSKSSVTTDDGDQNADEVKPEGFEVVQTRPVLGTGGSGGSKKQDSK